MLAPHRFIRLLVLVALLSLSIGVAACGSEDEEPSEQEIRKTLAERQAKEDASAKKAITRLYAIMGDAWAGKPGATAEKVCGLMGRQAQAEAIEYVESQSKGEEQLDCEDSVEALYLAPMRGTGKKPPEVLGASTDGGFGHATVDSGKVITSVPIAKEYDGWKLSAESEAPSGDPDDTAPAAAIESAKRASSTLLP